MKDQETIDRKISKILGLTFGIVIIFIFAIVFTVPSIFPANANNIELITNNKIILFKGQTYEINARIGIAFSGDGEIMVYHRSPRDSYSNGQYLADSAIISYVYSIKDLATNDDFYVFGAHFIVVSCYRDQIILMKA